MKTQKGFTLIELIIVIVVLGILAVTAAPQFFNFSSDARVSTLEGLRGSMNGAADLVFGKAAIAGVEGDANDGATTPAYITVDSIEVVYGYPAATAAGITAALNITPADWQIAYTAATGDPGDTATSVRFAPAGTIPTADFSAADHTTVDECYVEYTDVDDAGDRPTITVVTTGC
ncbi:pilus assembly FimT family protein [Pseudidiomarina donghaiensis]|uniref:Type II secretion system protein n=1 Tax=Pseudidiomarina donghaiensis TaxID=519452 RepID=A0A432XKF9_9GAMM|nr:type II secretion system protein [Pseudidiomarina donghaiensis]RUO49122.1 type II secretion system protein [Pseudidiomarina donghaiensis]SFV20658.1 MSHA pilin protein MshA [Pseudidiomarina donghaiensis]